MVMARHQERWCNPCLPPYRFWFNVSRVCIGDRQGLAPDRLMALNHYTGFADWHKGHVRKRAQLARVTHHMRRFVLRRIMQRWRARGDRNLKLKWVFANYKYYSNAELPNYGMLAFKCALLSGRHEWNVRADFLLAWRAYTIAAQNLK